jgi:predicted nucleic acid-binding protein
MGWLNLPEGAKVYLDANILIYIVEKHPQWGGLLQPLLEAAHLRRLTLMTSHLSVLECLVIPTREQNNQLIQAYREHLFESDLVLLAITLDVIQTSVNLKASHVGLKTPDAIHLATAMLHQADLVLTNDADWGKVLPQRVQLLSQIQGGSHAS